MSHVVSVNLEIKDLTSLAKACERLGLELKLNQKSFKWYGRFMNDYSGADAAYRNGVSAADYGKCTHAIGIKGSLAAYEIGVLPGEKAGTFKLVWDNWQGGYGLVEKIGKDGGLLKQSYGVETAKKHIGALKYQGWQIKETTDANGDIVVQAVKY